MLNNGTIVTPGSLLRIFIDKMAKSYFEKSVLKLFPFILILGLEIDEIIIILLENSVFIDFAKNVKFSSILSKSIFLNLLCL